jgi:hypothetical protein
MSVNSIFQTDVYCLTCISWSIQKVALKPARARKGSTGRRPKEVMRRPIMITVIRNRSSNDIPRMERRKWMPFRVKKVIS